jgi:hypothetical protein
MKPQHQQSLTQQQISDYEAMNEEFIKEGTEFRIDLSMHRPNPPSAEAIKRAQFVDKTYHWNNADLRSGDKRPSK